MHVFANRYAHAMDCFTRVVKWLPTHRYANLQLAYLTFHAKQFDKSLAHCQRVLETHPKDLVAWGQLLETLNRLSDQDAVADAIGQAQALDLPLERIQEIGKSLRIPPQKRVQCLVEILKQGNLLNTEIAARLFIDHYPEHPIGWQVLGEALHNADNLSEALDVKQKAVEMFPKDANVHNNLARTYLSLKDPESALDSSKRALALDPKHPMAALHLSKAEQALARQRLTSA